MEPARKQSSFAIYEEVDTLFHGRVRRVRTSIVLTLSLLSAILGFALIATEYTTLGLILLTTIAPCFLLYPAVRATIFMGKDSFLAVVVTFVLEELLKHKIKKTIRKIEEKKY